MNYEDFDIISYYEARGIEYWTHGKNVQQGWVNIECRFHDDHSNHLGVNLESMKYNCWVCGKKGFITHLIQTIEKCSIAQANTIIERFKGAGLEYTEPVKLRYFDQETLVLPGNSQFFPSAHLRYLEERGFDPYPTIEKYELHAMGPTGKYKFRIIVPITINGQTVNFVARDITGRAERRYLQCPDSEAIIPAGECLYNIDNAGDTVIITEGVTDVWRIGDGAIATLGMELTSKRLRLLKEQEIKSAFVLFDSGEDANKRANVAANQLATFFSGVEILLLDSGDPADLDSDSVKSLREDIFNQ
ncbi:MAG: hypothetical protein ACXABY_30165 [Candidatus Thorarchaeota archaeon]